MSFEAFEKSETQNGAPGLLFPYSHAKVDSGIIQEDKDSEGGFVLFEKQGEPGKFYVTGGEGKVFAGIAKRVTTRDCYVKGDPISCIRKGKLWVRVLGEVLSTNQAYFNSTNYALTATSSGATQIPGGKFTSNAADKGLAELVID